MYKYVQDLCGVTFLGEIKIFLIKQDPLSKIILSLASTVCSFVRKGLYLLNSRYFTRLVVLDIVSPLPSSLVDALTFFLLPSLLPSFLLPLPFSPLQPVSLPPCLSPPYSLPFPFVNLLEILVLLFF